MLVPSNQSRRIVIALEDVEILRQEKQSCARRGSWSSLPRPPWRTSRTALFPLFSSNAILRGEKKKGEKKEKGEKEGLFLDLSCFMSDNRETHGDPPIRRFRPVRSRAKLSKHGVKKTITLEGHQARILVTQRRPSYSKVQASTLMR